jgi:hypothetical protein
MKPNAYEIESKLMQAFEMIDQETGEITPEGEAILAEVEEAAPVAVEIYGKVRANALAECETIKGAIEGVMLEVDRLKAALAERLRTADRMLERVGRVLEATGEDKIKGETFTAQWSKVAPALGDVDESKIPACYWVSNTTQRVDRKTLLVDLKTGKTVPGATILTGRKRVSLK